VARREGEGRGGQDGADGRGQTGEGGGVPNGGGVGCSMRWGGVPDRDLWGLDRMGGCPNGKDAGDRRGGCPNKGEG
jgi:hypothetical protein